MAKTAPEPLRTTAQIIPLPTAAAAPVVQRRGAGRWPKKVVSMLAFQIDRDQRKKAEEWAIARRSADLIFEKVRILVATDIVARGIDVVDIAHVINYNVPENPDDYVHRIGRTARAFKTGLASTIASLEELVELRAIDQTLGEPVPRKHVPGIKTFEERPKQKTGRLRPMSPRRAGIKRRWYGDQKRRKRLWH